MTIRYRRPVPQAAEKQKPNAEQRRNAHVSPETPQSPWRAHEWSGRLSSSWHRRTLRRSCRRLVITCVAHHRPPRSSRT